MHKGPAQCPAQPGLPVAPIFSPCPARSLRLDPCPGLSLTSQNAPPDYPTFFLLSVLRLWPPLALRPAAGHTRLLGQDLDSHPSARSHLGGRAGGREGGICLCARVYTHVCVTFYFHLWQSHLWHGDTGSTSGRPLSVPPVKEAARIWVAENRREQPPPWELSAPQWRCGVCGVGGRADGLLTAASCRQRAGRRAS